MRPQTRSRSGWNLTALAALSVAVAACSGGPTTGRDGGADLPPPSVSGLRINEVMADDDGTCIDEAGETEDWVELVNTGAAPVDLSAFTLGDGKHLEALPPQTLPPGERVQFWADDQPDQGVRHLRFKISADGSDVVVLRDRSGTLVDQVDVPALGLNQAYARFPDGNGAFARCAYASPGHANGAQCGPSPPPGLPPTVEFAPYPWPDAPPGPSGPLAITEVALFPARFVEVQNTSTATVELNDVGLFLQPLTPGDPLPDGFGVTVLPSLPWPGTATNLAPGARVLVPVASAQEADIAANPEREGILTLQRKSDRAVLDRVPFMRWPDGAALVRDVDASGRLGSRFHFNTDGTPEPTDAGVALSARAVGDRVHQLATDGDFAALAEGGTELDSQSVKFVVDMSAGDVVHFLSGQRWDLHYRFIRERIYHQPALDRCDPAQAAEFNAGWIDFSLREYFRTDRRFLLGTLVRWGGRGLGTVEFAVGDVITGEQMRRAFFAVTSQVPDRRAWSVRPQAADQVQRIRSVEGTLPIVDPNAPFRGQTFQPLVAATGYGVLRFVLGSELATAPLGRDVVVITDEVPNDIPLVGGLITEAFQTPLAHVAVLSKNRGTPNMALLGAHTDPRLAPLLGQLVRLEVNGAGFTVQKATPEEAAAFWEQQRPQGPRVAPRLDTTVRDLVDLRSASLEDLPVVGAKAAQIGELYQLVKAGVTCPRGVPLPNLAMGLPLVHSLEHFTASGAAAILARISADPAFASDPAVRARGLAEVQAAILAAPVEPGLLLAVTNEIRARFGSRSHVRLRSSSNTEDLPGFTGAGLYTSVSVAVDDPDPDLDVANGLRTVWASLWTPRAYDEREEALVDHASAAMGVLIEPAFPNERANGVAISRNILDPIYGDASYFNAQAGEASVTNPAPGVTSEQGTYESGRPPRVLYTSRSSLTADPVVSTDELTALMCALGAIHKHFQARIDPSHANRWFAMDIEWKLVGPERQLVIKQARPYSFGRAEVPHDCREF